MIGRAFQIVLLLANVTLAGFVLYFVMKGGAPVSNGPEYKDFVAILLTALGVMIAIAAFFVAFFAVWGYKELRNLVSEAAKAEADVEIRRQLGPSLRQLFEKEPGLLISAVRESRSALFGDIDPNEAEEIAEAIDDPRESKHTSSDKGSAAISSGQS